MIALTDAEILDEIRKIEEKFAADVYDANKSEEDIWTSSIFYHGEILGTLLKRERHADGI